MKKVAMCALIAILGYTAYSYSKEPDYMQLINKNNGFLVVEYKHGDVRFYDPALEEEIRELGVSIPYALRGDYDNKEKVYIDDDMFQKAFKEIYVKYYFDPKVYIWKAVED